MAVEVDGISVTERTGVEGVIGSLIEKVVEARKELAKMTERELDMTRALQLVLRSLPRRRVSISRTLVEEHDVRDWTLMRWDDPVSGDMNYGVERNEDARRGVRLTERLKELGLLADREQL